MSQHNIIIIIQPCRGILDKKIFIRNLSSNGDCFCEIIDYMNKVNVSFRETLPPDIMKIVIELLNRKKVVVPSKVIQNWKGLIATGQLASPNNLQYFNGSKTKSNKSFIELRRLLTIFLSNHRESGTG